MQVIFCNLLVFLLGWVVGIVGAFVNQQFQGWELSAFNMLGWMCVALGIVLVLLSLLGVCAARRNRTHDLWLFLYFVLLLSLCTALALAAVLAAVEADKVGQYITENWAVTHERLGLAALAAVDGNADAAEPTLSLDDAIALLHEYLLVILGVLGERDEWSRTGRSNPPRVWPKQSSAAAEQSRGRVVWPLQTAAWPLQPTVPLPHLTAHRPLFHRPLFPPRSSIGRSSLLALPSASQAARLPSSSSLWAPRCA